MTTIIDGYKSKAALKRAISNGEAARVYVQDPSVIGALSGYLPDVLKKKKRIVACLDHPKRSRFTNITLNESTGKITVT